MVAELHTGTHGSIRACHPAALRFACVAEGQDAGLTKREDAETRLDLQAPGSERQRSDDKTLKPRLLLLSSGRPHLGSKPWAADGDQFLTARVSSSQVVRKVACLQ